ncbi:RNHCP domain-containing protein [Clostridia bacterium]|nr:RNHCP domain-containing protein [Clostridia bacterium]
MSKETENVGFVCENCGCDVRPLSNGSFRNHCPACLCSKHVDNQPGDRIAKCFGLMEPVGVVATSKKGLQILHRCLMCGEERLNKIAENTEQCDDYQFVLELMKEAGKRIR